MEYCKIPVIYYFEIHPSSKEFMKSYLNSIDFSKIQNFNYSIAMVDSRIDLKDDGTIIEILLLLEAKVPSKSEFADHLKPYIKNLDKFFSMMSENFKNSFSFNKKIYL